MSWAAILSALWFGILTSISPCPLATNIAAISFIARKVEKMRAVLLSGLLYAAGRTVAYVLLGALIMVGLLASGEIALFLQKYLNQILGPILILVGMLLLGLLNTTASVSLVGAGMQERAAKGGLGWAALLGLLFALSFCPVSAGLFFGVLIPLSAANQSMVILPLVYGVGTAAPVIVFALLIAFASQRLGSAFNRLTQIERWVRRVTGLVFILAGIYYSLLYVYELPYGNPTQEIVDFCRREKVSLVVMGTQGRGYVSEILLGSISHNVARYAPVPILLIPRRAS